MLSTSTRTDRAIRIAVIVLAIGFVPAVISAWIFEWTPEGLKRDADTAGQPVKATRGFDRGIIVVLLLAVSYFAVDKFVLTEPGIDQGFYGERSIAVMPFEIRSSDPEQQHFANGVTDEIRYLLGTIRDLRIIAEFSTGLLDKHAVDISDVWGELRIGHLLEGSVRQDGNRVRVTARLVETRTGAQLWTDVYEREVDDVFRIQDDIARNVLHNLKIELDEALPQSRNVNPEARALVQQASQVFYERPEDTGAKMYPLAKRAVELDPGYPEAIKWMSYAEWYRGYDGLIPEDEAQARSEELAARYVELAPNSGHFEAVQAWEYDVAGELELAAEQFLLSLEKNLSDAEQLRWAGRFALVIGKMDVGVSILEHALAVDPLNHQVRRILSQALMYRGAPGDLRRAIDVREQYLASAASGGRSYYSLLLILAGEPERVADVWLDFPVEVHHQKTAYMAMADYSMGNVAGARAKLASLEDRLAKVKSEGANQREQEDLRYAVATVAAWMGDADKAFSSLLPPRQSARHFVRQEFHNPQWHEIRDDPRWLEYRDAIGMSQERLDAIEFDPWLPE
jgi:TolB-like protein